MVEPAEKITDTRVEFIKEVCLRTLRVKPEKWDRIMISDEQRNFIMGFIERQTPQVILSMYNKWDYDGKKNFSVPSKNNSLQHILIFTGTGNKPKLFRAFSCSYRLADTFEEQRSVFCETGKGTASEN